MCFQHTAFLLHNIKARKSPRLNLGNIPAIAGKTKLGQFPDIAVKSLCNNRKLIWANVSILIIPDNDPNNWKENYHTCKCFYHCTCAVCTSISLSFNTSPFIIKLLCNSESLSFYSSAPQYLCTFRISVACTVPLVILVLSIDRFQCSFPLSWWTNPRGQAQNRRSSIAYTETQRHNYFLWIIALIRTIVEQQVVNYKKRCYVRNKQTLFLK